MRVVSANKIRDTVANLCIQANLILRCDVLSQLKVAYLKETNRRPKDILGAIIKNARIAKVQGLAICQDTGMPYVFLELGQNVKIIGDLKAAINKGVELGYKKGCLRSSIIKDPLLRKKTAWQPAIIHIDIVKGNRIKLTVLPQGFGAENKTQLKMFLPTTKIDEIKKFIIEAVKNAGPDACPPYFVGVGIGGTADYAMYLAKKALLREIKPKGQSPSGTVPKLERDLLKEINKLNIGPMGLGGKTTALSVNIETYPTHIAGLPVAVNISCHASRRATQIL